MCLLVELELAQTQVGDLIRQIGSAGLRGVRLVRPEGIHLTLKFLGGVEAEKVPEVVDAVGKVSGKAAPFSLHTVEIGGFPWEDRARVVWVGVGRDLDALTGL